MSFNFLFVAIILAIPFKLVNDLALLHKNEPSEYVRLSAAGHTGESSARFL